MKILILNWRDPQNPLAGGAEISLLEHAKYWKKMGSDVTWIASSFRDAKKRDSRDGIKIVRFGNHYTVHLLFVTYWLLGRINKNVDLMIDCFHFAPFFTPLYVRKTKKIALINEVAGKLWFSNSPFPLSWIGYQIEPLFFKLYKNIQFITASESAKKDLLKVGIEDIKITIVPHGTLLPKRLPDIKKEENPTIIYCSRITEDKGIEDAIKVFLIMKAKTENLKFWIVGKEEEKGYLEKLFSTHKVKSKDIKYFGFVNEEEKFKLLRRAWVLVHPSKKEGWGLNVIEANSVGTPAVGYDVEGLRDSIKDKETGLLSNTKPEDLADKIMLLIEDKKMYKRISKNASSWSKNFRWKKSGEKSWKILNS